MIPPLPPRFINWKAVQNGDRTEKLPCDPHGNTIDAHDQRFHLTHAAAAATGLPVAYAMRDEDNWFFLDLDKCLQDDGQWRAEALAIWQSFPGCWGEVSQSGRGLHIMGRCDASKLKDRKHRWDGWLEFYTGGRFIAFGSTGWQPVGGQAAEYDWTGQLLKIVPQKTVLGDLPVGVDPTYTGPADDAELIRKALAAAGSAGSAFGLKASFADLWEARVEALAKVYPGAVEGTFDHSAADAALLTHLAFWTGKDMPRMDRLFRQSGLMRDKYRDRADYRTESVGNAARLCKKVYDTPARQAGGGLPGLPTASGDDAGQFYMTTTEQVTHFAGHVYISDLHRIMGPTGKIMKPEVFNVEKGGFIFQMQANGNGPSKKAFEAFTENRAVRFPKVSHITFDPKRAGGEIIGDSVNVYFDPKVDKTPGDISPFIYLVGKLLPNDTDRTILLNYMAAVVQKPGVKFQWAPVLQGCEGNGKTALFSCVAYAVGQQYTHMPKASQLTEKYNGYVEAKVFILIEEIHMRGKYEILDEMKPLITNRNLEIRPMGGEKRMIQNFANFGLCTNFKDAVIKSVGDRRYAIFYTAQQSPADLVRDGLSGPFFPAFWKWLDKQGGYAAVAHYLSTFPIDPAYDPSGDVHRAPATSSTFEAMRRTTGPIEADILEAAADNTPGFRGGWASSWAVDQLMQRRRHGVNRNKQVEILEALGYIAWGRAPRGILAEEGKRPMLFRLPGVEGTFDDYCRAQNYSG